MNDFRYHDGALPPSFYPRGAAAVVENAATSAAAIAAARTAGGYGAAGDYVGSVDPVPVAAVGTGGAKVQAVSYYSLARRRNEDARKSVANGVDHSRADSALVTAHALAAGASTAAAPLTAFAASNGCPGTHVADARHAADAAINGCVRTNAADARHAVDTAVNGCASTNGADARHAADAAVNGCAGISGVDARHAVDTGACAGAGTGTGSSAAVAVGGAGSAYGAATSNAGAGSGAGAGAGAVFDAGASIGPDAGGVCAAPEEDEPVVELPVAAILGVATATARATFEVAVVLPPGGLRGGGATVSDTRRGRGYGRQLLRLPGCHEQMLVARLHERIKEHLHVGPASYFLTCAGRRCGEPLLSLSELGLVASGGHAAQAPEGRGGCAAAGSLAPTASVMLVPRRLAALDCLFVCWQEEVHQISDWTAARSLGWLRAAIATASGVPIAEQVILLGARENVGEREITLGSCGLQPFSLLHLLRRAPRPVQPSSAAAGDRRAQAEEANTLRVSLPDGREMALGYAKDVTLAMLEEQVSAAVGVAAADLALFSAGRPLSSASVARSSAGTPRSAGGAAPTLDQLGLAPGGALTAVARGSGAVALWPKIAARLSGPRASAAPVTPQAASVPPAVRIAERRAGA
eukprot:TRINITY_DN4453_c0_g1_i1.p1 TRINITY_DN4453_c0_g1~~TRINITY_DN4453_c0_g1_i1.p1  ORF type:complete len:639 (-),score=121.66 TRINITY_DN4453_c0_g1_i1:132-2048(-)